MADTASNQASRTTSRTHLRLPTDLTLTPLEGEGLGQTRPIMDWLTTFHLASVVLDPYTNESSWVLRAATRILEQFRDTDARINLIVTAGPEDARAFLGPLAEQYLGALPATDREETWRDNGMRMIDGPLHRVVEAGLD